MEPPWKTPKSVSHFLHSSGDAKSLDLVFRHSRSEQQISALPFHSSVLSPEQQSPLHRKTDDVQKDGSTPRTVRPPDEWHHQRLQKKNRASLKKLLSASLLESFFPAGE